MNTPLPTEGEELAVISLKRRVAELPWPYTIKPPPYPYPSSRPISLPAITLWLMDASGEAIYRPPPWSQTPMLPRTT
jgi:hypothetical protein